MNARAIVGHPPLLAAILVRSAILWGMLRAILFLLRADLAGAAPLIGICVLGGVLALLDARVTRETMFLRNLGLPPAWLFALTSSTMAVLEGIVRLAAR